MHIKDCSMRIFDIHVHIYPDKIAQKASRSIGDFYDGMTIQGNGTLGDYLQRIDGTGIERFAAHSVAMTPHNVEKINSFILEARDREPERIVPFAALHPDMPDMRAAVRRIADQGFCGFKIHPDIQRFELDGDRAMPMMRAVADVGLPLLIHCGDTRYDFDGPKRILSLHNKLPELTMICAHFGGWMEWDDAADILPGNGLYVDTSSALFRWTPEHAADIIHRFGAEYVLYGTDYPMWDPTEELQRFMRIPLTEQERADICWNNAANLLKL